MKKKVLLIWTNNPAKLQRWSKYFWDLFEVHSLKDRQIVHEVEESLHDLKGNAIKKATSYAQISGCLTLSEDMGFFINELWGLPWVAVRRWWWELKSEVSDAEFLSFFKKKIEGLQDLSAYFAYEIAVALPDGSCVTVNKTVHWKIDKMKLETIQDHVWGYPLSKCFVNDVDGKTWFESSDEEREAKDREIVLGIKEVLERYLESGRV